jgi:DNA polymerase III delta subunit
MSEVHLVTGNDDEGIRAEARKIVDRLAGPDADEFALEVHAESEDRAPAEVVDDVLGSVLTPALFGGAKTVWLRHFAAFSDEAAKSSAANHPLTQSLYRLADQVAAGLPDGINLVMSGPKVDRKKRFCTTCAKGAKVSVQTRPELARRGWRKEVEALIRQGAADRGMKLPKGAVPYLTEAIGVDTGRIANELEKIYCYAGTQPSLAHIQEQTTGTREAMFYALNTALGARDTAAVLRTITQFLSHTTNPDSAAIGQVRLLAGWVRDVLHAKLLMHALRARSGGALASAVDRLDAARRQQYSYNVCLSKSSFVVRSLGDAAARYSGAELVDAVRFVAVADRTVVSTSRPRRLVLEALALQIVRGRQAAAR